MRLCAKQDKLVQNFFRSSLRTHMIVEMMMYYSGKTLSDFLEALPREWISEDLIEALMEKGVHLSPTVCVTNHFVMLMFIHCLCLLK